MSNVFCHLWKSSSTWWLIRTESIKHVVEVLADPLCSSLYHLIIHTTTPTNIAIDSKMSCSAQVQPNIVYNRCTVLGGCSVAQLSAYLYTVRLPLTVWFCNKFSHGASYVRNKLFPRLMKTNRNDNTM